MPLILIGPGRTRLFVGLMEGLHKSLALRARIKTDWDLKRDPVRVAGLIEAEHLGVAKMLRAGAPAFPTAVWHKLSNWMERATARSC